MKAKLFEVYAFRVLVFASFVFLLAGCGEKNESAASGNSSNTQGISEITLSSYYDSPFLDEAAKIFSEQNPDTPVKINIYKPVDGAEDKDAIEMYVTYINTALASGSADDILIMSNLPYYRYGESLADLMPYMQNGFPERDYFSELFEALDENGKRYTLPIDFSMEIFAFHENYAEHFGDSVSFAACNSIGKNLIDNLGGENDFKLFGYDGFQLFFAALNTNYHRFLDFPGKKSNLQNGDFLQMFKDFKDLENGGYIPTSQDFFDGNIPENYLVQYSAVVDLQLLAGYSKPFTKTALATGEGGEVYFSAYTQLGINDASKNKDAAWRFVEFLLSEQMQSSPQQIALPVNKNAMRFAVRRKLEEINQTRKENGEFVNEDLTSLTNSVTEKIESYVSKVEYYGYYEPIVTNVIFEEGYNFFLGNVPAEEVVNIIDNKIRLYLAE
jgi:multiple sugar transport system substrate-binding protein